VPRIAICDDDIDDLACARHALAAFTDQHPEWRFSVHAYDNALECAEALDQAPGFDVLLLDICMPGLMGTQIARELRDRNDTLEIVFLTGSADFAVEAFSLKAAHYLLKPYSQAAFDEALSTALERLGAHRTTRVALKSRAGELRSVDIDGIVYVEGARHSQNVHLADGGVVEARQTLAELLEALEGADAGRFATPYKGYIVNLSHVQAISSCAVTMDEGSTVPLAKRTYRAMKECFFDYAFRAGGPAAGAARD